MVFNMANLMIRSKVQGQQRRREKARIAPVADATPTGRRQAGRSAGQQRGTAASRQENRAGARAPARRRARFHATLANTSFDFPDVMSSPASPSSSRIAANATISRAA